MGNMQFQCDICMHDCASRDCVLVSTDWREDEDLCVCVTCARTINNQFASKSRLGEAPSDRCSVLKGGRRWRLATTSSPKQSG